MQPNLELQKQNQSVLAILQARTSSSRLPNKVMMPILGQPMILRQIARIKGSSLISTLCLATSDDPSDDLLEELCRKNNIGVFRGSLTDVLDRFYKACLHFGEHDVIVRLTGDCPLTDPQIIDLCITKFFMDRVDYLSNCLNPTFPDGLDVEVFSRSALEKAWQESSLLSEREHVTPYIHKNPSMFKLSEFKNSQDLSMHRWTVDEPEDYQFVCAIYENLHGENPNFNWCDVLNLLKTKPELAKINSHFIRNEGYLKSLSKDTLVNRCK